MNEKIGFYHLDYQEYLKKRKEMEKRERFESLTYYEKVREEISTWLSMVSFSKFCNEIESKVLGQKELRVFLADVYSYLQAVANEMPINHNAIISAPSGCGKTETYRALKKYFKKFIPDLEVYIFDISQVTATGFKGMDIVELIRRFTQYAENDRRTVEAVGLVFMDEFDKEVEPRYTNFGENVSRQVQGNMLTVIEGSPVLIPNMKVPVYVDTTYTMFVGLGSFSALREMSKDTKYPIGIGMVKEWEACENERNEYHMLKREDFLDAGASAELIGRFPLICNYVELSEEIVRRVIHKTCENIKKSMSIRGLSISDDMMTELITSANTEFGCRMIDAKIKSLIMDAYAEALMKKKSPEDRLTIRINSEEDIYCSWEV